MGQINLEGGEVEAAVVPRRGSPGFTGLQRQILLHIDQHGHIRSVEAGVMVHRGRGINGECPGAGAKWHRFRGTGIACCPYAGADGLAAMVRLEKRGAVKRTGRGYWERVDR